MADAETVAHPQVAHQQVAYLTRYFQVTGDNTAYLLMQKVQAYMENSR